MMENIDAAEANNTTENVEVISSCASKFDELMRMHEEYLVILYSPVTHR